jgi:WD40 repeat protein
MVASLSDDRTVRLWQPTLGRLVRFARFKTRPSAAQWTADGRRLVVAFVDGRVRVLDPDTMKVVAEMPGSAERIHSLALCEKGTLSAVIGDAKGTVATMQVKSPSVEEGQ